MKHTLTIQQDDLFEQVELIIYADYELSGTSAVPDVELLDYQISAIIFGIECDITSEINYVLNKPQNHRKKAKFIDAILEQMPYETASDWLYEEKQNIYPTNED